MNKTLMIVTASFLIGACGNSTKTNVDNAEMSTSNPEAITGEHIENSATADQPQAQPSEYAIMTFKTTEHDFGDIVENQNVETTFEFTNTGKVDLMISSCNAQCGCTVPDWPRQPIPPGGKGSIKVSFNSSGRSGVNNKVVTVYANIEQKQIELKFRANVRALPTP